MYTTWRRGLLSDEHFTVDGTQLEAWASLKSFRPCTGPEGPPPDDPGNPTLADPPPRQVIPRRS